MKSSQLACLAAALNGSAMAFTVNLWNGPMCTSTGEGQYDLTVGDSQCITAGAGVAQAATIKAGAGDSSGDTVAFYTSNDCNPDNVYAEGDSGCVDVTGDSNGSYGSFNAVGDGNGSRLKLRSASRTPENENPLKIEHGQVKSVLSGTYKWHQIAYEAWQGIPLDQWDDTIHVKRDDKLDFDEFFPTNFSDFAFLQVRDLQTGELLDERDLRGVCTSALNCVITLGSVAHYGILDVSMKFLNAAIAAKDASQPLWDFLNTPFVAGITTATTGGVISGYVGSKTYNKPAMDTCSTANSDADAIQSALTKALSQTNGTTRDVEITITLASGASGTLHMAAYPNGASSNKDQDQCGSPADTHDNKLRTI